MTTDSDPIISLVGEVADKWKNTPAMIDALYQWCDNPTGEKMGGVTVNFDYIISNLRKRYSELEVVKINRKLSEYSTQLGSMGYSHEYTRDRLRTELRKKGLSAVVLRQLRKRLRGLSPRDKQIVGITFKALHGSTPAFTVWNRNYNDIPEELIGILLELEGRLDLDIEPTELIDVLISTGLMNKLCWETTTGNFHDEFIIPQSVLETIEKDVTKYEIPLPKVSVSEFVKGLYDNRRVEELALLDDLINEGGRNASPRYKVLPSWRGITKKSETVTVVAPLLMAQLKEEIRKMKINIIKDLNVNLTETMKVLRERYWPAIEIQRLNEETPAWRLEFGVENPTLFVRITPWIGKPQLTHLPSRSDHILIFVTDQALPSIEETLNVHGAMRDTTICVTSDGNLYLKSYDKEHPFVNNILNEMKTKKYEVSTPSQAPKEEKRIEARTIEQKESKETQVAKAAPLPFSITYPPYSNGKALVFGRGSLEGKVAWGFEFGKDLSPDSVATTDLYDINQPHVGSFQQTRTGKSTLAGSAILQVAFQGIPVVVFDPKPDYISNLIPITKTFEVVPDLEDSVKKRFLESKQDIRGFDFSKEITFDYKDRELKLQFRTYSFDKDLRSLPNCRVLKLPFVVLPSIDDPDFKDMCNAAATSIANCLPRSQGKGYNVILTSAIQAFKKREPQKDFMLVNEVIEELSRCKAESKREKKRIEDLSDAIKEFYTANSYLYACNEGELIKIQDITKNPEHETGDHRTVSISVIDVSALPQEKRNPILLNYVSQVCGQLLNFARKNKTKRAAQLFIVFDEAQNYLPDPSDLYNYVRVIITRGASIGIKAWLIAQSPQAIEKEARKQFTTLILSKVNASAIRDEVSKFVQNEAWTAKLRDTELGKSLIVNQQTGKEGGRLCITFTTPQTVNVLSPKQIAEIAAGKR